MWTRITLIVTAAANIFLNNSPAISAETINYTYDSKGRVVKVEHSGTVNSGISVQYNYDSTDNRTNVNTTGASH
jgi:hypothetical protein